MRDAPAACPGRDEAASRRDESRCAIGVYKGHRVDISVKHHGACNGSHVVVAVDGDLAYPPLRMVEYVTDCDDFDEAMAAGEELARAVVDGQRIEWRDPCR